MDASISNIAKTPSGKNEIKTEQTFVYSGVDITPELKRLTSASTSISSLHEEKGNGM